MAEVRAGRSGSAGLSLRAVARELGLASSALYRYFPSRDDLLTTLIVEAYAALGDDIIARLLHAGQYEMGITLEILAEAMEEAIDRGAKGVTRIDFANAYAARNLMPDDQNPFRGTPFEQFFGGTPDLGQIFSQLPEAGGFTWATRAAPV